MELQELVERIERWRSRQAGTASNDLDSHSSHAAPHRAAPVEYDDGAAVAEEAAAELEVESEAIVAEDSTAEVKLDQIEEVG